MPGAHVLDRLLDRTIALSFDRTGFHRHARHFDDPAPERDLSGTDILITGGTSGIGLAAARALADRGAHLTLWGRDPAKGAAAAATVGGRFTSVDLGNLDAVAEAARAWSPTRLSAVVLNAGGMPHDRKLTPQGHELIWASQVLGHLLLLRILHQRGLLGPDTRVVWVSSGGMYAQRLDLRDPTWVDGYQRHTVYANAKRAQVMLSRHLAQRWPEVPMAAMHPGWVKTTAVKHAMPVFYRVTRPILRTTEQGADTIVWLVAREAPPPSGRFWFDRAEQPVHLVDRTRASEDDAEPLVRRVFADTEPWVSVAH